MCKISLLTRMLLLLKPTFLVAHVDLPFLVPPDFSKSFLINVFRKIFYEVLTYKNISFKAAYAFAASDANHTQETVFIRYRAGIRGNQKQSGLSLSQDGTH